MPRVPRRTVSASAAPLTNLVQLFPPKATPAPHSPPDIRDVHEWRTFGESLSAPQLAAIVAPLPARPDHVALLTEWMTLGASMPPRQLAVVLANVRQAAARSVRA